MKMVCLLPAALTIACVLGARSDRVKIKGHVSQTLHGTHASHAHANDTFVTAVNQKLEDYENVIEFSVKQNESVKKNKFAYVLLAMFFFFGADRCYMGYVGLGCIKGCGMCCAGPIFNVGTVVDSCRVLILLPLIFAVWALVDYVVAVVNAITMQESIKTAGYDVDFDKDGIESAFYIALVFGALPILLPGVVVCCCCVLATGAASTASYQPQSLRERVKLSRQISNELRDGVVTRLPKPVTKRLRQACQLDKKPSYAEIKDLFERYDTNHDGTLDLDEFKAALAKIGVDDETTEDMQNAMFTEIDENHDGKINLKEFMTRLTPSYAEEPEESKVEESKVEELKKENLETQS